MAKNKDLRIVLLAALALALVCILPGFYQHGLKDILARYLNGELLEKIGTLGSAFGILGAMFTGIALSVAFRSIQVQQDLLQKSVEQFSISLAISKKQKKIGELTLKIAAYREAYLGYQEIIQNRLTRPEGVKLADLEQKAADYFKKFESTVAELELATVEQN